MGKLYSYMVTKNESSRRLTGALMNLCRFVDGFLVYDDQSEDYNLSPLWKAIFGGECLEAACQRRPDDVPSFLENESEFRAAAWRAMEHLFQPREGDWIITLDADEELAPASREAIDTLTDSTVADGIWLPVREIWQDNDEGMYARTDGFWGDITALRLVAYKPHGVFQNKTMGGGSVPSYVQTTIRTDDLEIYHFGYTEQADREARYERYRDRSGHNPKHIESILAPPTLKKMNA